MKVDTKIEILRSRDALVRIGNYLDDSMITDLFDTAINALNKQTPKIPKYRDTGNTSLFGEALCPICGNLVFGTEKFCSECGQALDWSEVEE